MHTEKKALPITIEAVKNCIGFEPGSGLHTSLSGLCDTWYAIEKEKGASDKDAAKTTLDKLGKRLLEIGK